MTDEMNTQANQRRRGGGRKVRRDERQNLSPSSAVSAGVMGGTFKPLSDIDVEKIHLS